MRRTQNFTDEFARQADVVTVPCLAGDLGVGIHQRNGFPNNRPRSVAIVNVVASGFGLFAAHGFRDEIEVPRAHGGFAPAGAWWRKDLLSCDALAVFTNFRRGGARLLTIASHGDHFAWPGGMVGSSGPEG